MQRRLRQAGRIRTGTKVPTKNGGTRPAKLESFRFTSPDQAAIEAVAEVYGGDPQVWEGASVGTQWEVFAKATELDIVVPPTDIAFSQWYEMWSGGGCQRRCDGVTNILSDSPCACDPENPDCKPTTRLNVILAPIEGIGVWRLESHGYNSAAELGGSIEVLKTMQARGTLIPGRLLLEQRQSKVIDQKTGKAETFNFAVPVLDFKLSVAAIANGNGHGQLVAGVTPIQSGVPAVPSVAEQLSAKPVERPARSNAAAQLPSTGLKPRGMSTEIESDDKPKLKTNKLFALIGGRKDIEDRHQWASGVLERPIESFTELTQQDVTTLENWFKATPEKQYAPDDPERPFT